MITLIGDVASDILVRVPGLLPGALVVGGDTPARIQTLPGGSAAGTAAWLASTHTAVRLIASIGRDRAGEDLRAVLERHGVETRFQDHDAPTSAIVVLVDDSGERTMLPEPGANALLSPDWCRDNLSGAHLHLSGYTLYREGTRSAAVTAIATARSMGMTTSIDLNSHGLVRENAHHVIELLPQIDILLANRMEYAALGEPELSDTIIVVTSGANGVRWVGTDHSGHEPAISTNVVDTVGAGDAFAAGFLSAWVVDRDTPRAVRAGVTLAAQCVARVGAGPHATD